MGLKSITSVERIGGPSVGLVVDELVKNRIEVVGREFRIVRGSNVIGGDDLTGLVTLRLEEKEEAGREGWNQDSRGRE